MEVNIKKWFKHIHHMLGFQVILAMDEGQYDGKVDVWSLGITCIGTTTAHLLKPCKKINLFWHPNFSDTEISEIPIVKKGMAVKSLYKVYPPVPVLSQTLR
jgi:hypothetical protein